MMTLPTDICAIIFKKIGFFSGKVLSITCKDYNKNYDAYRNSIAEIMEPLPIDKKIAQATANEVFGLFIIQWYKHELGKYNDIYHYCHLY